MKLHAPTQRIFQVIEALTKYSAVSIETLVEETHIPYTSIYRMLQACVRLGYVDFTSNHQYRLSQKLFHISSSYLHEQCPLSIIARPSLQQLYYHTKETIHLGIIKNNVVLYIDKIETEHKIRMYSYIGYQAEIHCTSLGKAIVSYLDEEAQEQIINNITFTKHTSNTLNSKKLFKEELLKTCAQGYAEDNEENETCLYCIGAPIFDAYNKVVGAVSISILLFRFDPKVKPYFIQKLWECAKNISHELGNQNYNKCLNKTS